MNDHDVAPGSAHFHRPMDGTNRLEETYAQAAKQCGVLLWLFDFATKTIYNPENKLYIEASDHVDLMNNVPAIFTGSGSSLYPDDVPAFHEMFDQVLAGAKTAKSTGRWWSEIHQMWRWYEIAYTTIFGDDATPIKAIGTAVDITDRIRLEARYNEEIQWRKIRNQDVIGSFKMNLTKNTCDDGQSGNPVVLNFQKKGTVDGFFELDYATHEDEADLAEYRKVFERTSLLKRFQAGSTSVTHEAYVRFGEENAFWIKIELNMFQNPQSGDIEAYIYALDINQKKMARALVDAVVNMDYDFLALLDAVTGDY
ncbi:MAG: hypothetical protein RSD95_14685, partial [Clostridia bacterium]